MKKSTMYYNIAFLRVFATISVVLGHTLMYDSPIMLSVYKIIYSYHIPLFVFISGYLFMDSQFKSNNNFVTVVIKKIKHLILPILLVYLFWIIPAHILISRDLSFSVSEIALKIKDLFYGNVEYLWFLFMLFWVTILFYPISKIYKKRYSHIFIMIIGFLLILIFLKTSLYNLPNIYSISQASKYLFYFYLGATFYKYRTFIESFIRNNKGIVLIISIFMVLNSQVYILYNYETYVGAWFITSHLWSYLATSTITIIFLYIITVCYDKQIENLFIRSKIMVFLNKNSLGIYYVHTQMGSIIIQLINKTNIQLTKFNKISTLFFFMLIMSSIVIIIYNKVKVHILVFLKSINWINGKG